MFPKIQTLASLFFLALAWAADAAASEPIAVIPYRMAYDGVLIVPVTIDGRGPYDFMLDSGSTVTLAFQNLALKENFQPTGAAPRRVLGISGSALLEPRVMGDVAVGNAVLADHVGVVLADWEAPRVTPAGIIGADFLRRYAVYINVKARTLSLYPRGGLPNELIANADIMKLRPVTFVASSGPLYTTLAIANQTRVTFIVDLGSVATLVNYSGAEAIFNRSVMPSLPGGVVKGIRANDAFNERTQVKLADLDRLQAGRAVWRRVKLWVHDANIFNEIGVQRRPYGLLGADVLLSQDIALDFGENRVYVVKDNP